METISVHKLRSALRVRPQSIVDFMSSTCLPCREVPGVLKQLQSYRFVPVFVVNVEEDIGAVSEQFRVRSLPTIVLYEHGLELARIEGAVDFRTVVSRFGRFLGIS
jgi:thioredoxin 2